MTPELRDHLLCITENAIERAEDHLDWLAHHPQEPDCETQVADTKRSIDLSRQLLDSPCASGSLPA
jgi:hypothetical protein